MGSATIFGVIKKSRSVLLSVVVFFRKKAPKKGMLPNQGTAFVSLIFDSELNPPIKRLSRTPMTA